MVGRRTALTNKALGQLAPEQRQLNADHQPKKAESVEDRLGNHSHGCALVLPNLWNCGTHSTQAPASLPDQESREQRRWMRGKPV